MYLYPYAKRICLNKVFHYCYLCVYQDTRKRVWFFIRRHQNDAVRERKYISTRLKQQVQCHWVLSLGQCTSNIGILCNQKFRVLRAPPSSSCGGLKGPLGTIRSLWPPLGALQALWGPLPPKIHDLSNLLHRSSSTKRISIGLDKT